MHLGTRVAVQERVSGFLTGLADRQNEVRRRRRTVLHSRAQALKQDCLAELHYPTNTHPTWVLVYYDNYGLQLTNCETRASVWDLLLRQSFKPMCLLWEFAHDTGVSPMCRCNTKRAKLIPPLPLSPCRRQRDGHTEQIRGGDSTK